MTAGTSASTEVSSLVAPRADDGAYLMGELRRLGAAIGLEESFKLRPGAISESRFLAGIDKQGLDPARLRALLRQIAMPPDLRRQFLDRLPEANKVGFGFDGDSRGGTYKVYLEFWDRLVAELGNGGDKHAPRLLFLGFKWDAADDRKRTVDRYTCHPMLPVSGIIARIESIYADSFPAFPTGSITDLIRRAARRLVQDSFVYTEVESDIGVRRSYDVNLYKSGLLMGQVETLLSELGDCYGIDPRALDAVTRKNRHRRLGHLSGGRNGREGDFLTFYCEVDEAT